MSSVRLMKLNDKYTNPAIRFSHQIFTDLKNGPDEVQKA